LEELRRLRKLKGLSQQDLAAKSGVSQYTITEIETGRRSDPRPSTLRKLAKALGVEVADFFREPEAPKEDAPPHPEPSEELRGSALSGVATGSSSARGKLTVEVPLTLLWRTEAALETLESVGELEPDERQQVREVRDRVREALTQV